MNKLITISILMLSVFMISCNSTEKTHEKTKLKVKTELPADRIDVVYFHAEHRCQSCYDIEAFTKYTLDTYFSKEMKDGEITFQTANVDDKKDYALAEEYKSGGSALFLNVIKNNKSNKIELTNFAFENYTNKGKFSLELRDKIQAELNKLR